MWALGSDALLSSTLKATNGSPLQPAAALAPATCAKGMRCTVPGLTPNLAAALRTDRPPQQRKWSRPHPVELLARDIASVRVRDVIRQEIRQALLGAGINPPPPPPAPKRRRPPLRLVEK